MCTSDTRSGEKFGSATALFHFVPSTQASPEARATGQSVTTLRGDIDLDRLLFEMKAFFAMPDAPR